MRKQSQACPPWADSSRWYWRSRGPEIDWAKLAREPATGRFVMITLGLIQRLSDLPMPPGVKELLERDPIVQGQIASIESRLLRSTSSKVTRTAQWRTDYARAMPTSLDRWRSFYSTLFRPSILEWMAVPLPEVLSPLYAVIRPYRLLVKRLRGARRTPG